MQVRPLCGALGAEVIEVDLSRLDKAAGEAIRNAWEKHLVLVFPGQDLSPEAQIAFTELFGPVEPHPLRTRAAVDGHPEVLILENRPLLELLLEVATRPDNVYRHRWREGDVLTRDNRSALHYAVLDYTEDMPRQLHRSTAGGEVPDQISKASSPAV